ncbi:MAG TPA: response regulator [Bacteroidia bacterium]|jgi:DNA-binding NarL/FixJ family response regulator|nr:response regulator [Bacteroidia bacterium]
MYSLLIIDDHSIVRTGIKLLTKEYLNSISEEAADGKTALKKIKEKNYDIILLDINMPDTDCGKLLSTILTISPETKILIFSMNEEDLFARHYLKLGAKGFLTKKSPDSEILYAIRQVLAGKRYISPQLAEAIGDDIAGSKNVNPFEALSERELTVVGYLLKGQTISGISEIMSLHPSTVGTYKTRIFEKLSIKSLIDLTELARIYNVL